MHVRQFEQFFVEFQQFLKFKQFVVQRQSVVQCLLRVEQQRFREFQSKWLSIPERLAVAERLAIG